MYPFIFDRCLSGHAQRIGVLHFGPFQSSDLKMSGTDDSSLAYQELQPDQILTSAESLGYRCDGRLLALNSYENRVYRIGQEDDAPIVAKFYRPGRWTDAAILEEHRFSADLAEQEIPVLPPLVHND